MRGAGLCVAVLLLSACSSLTGSVATREGAAPLASGVLKTLDSDSPSITGGLVWSGTVKPGARCSIHDGWVRIDAAVGVVWIPRERVTYVEFQPTSD